MESGPSGLLTYDQPAGQFQQVSIAISAAAAAALVTVARYPRPVARMRSLPAAVAMVVPQQLLLVVARPDKPEPFVDFRCISTRN